MATLVRTRSNGSSKGAVIDTELIINPLTSEFEDISSLMREVMITVEGTSPLMMHKFSEKAKAEMAAKQAGAGRAKKAPKVPEQLFHDATHFVKDTGDPKTSVYGFPAVGFKAAAASTWDMVTGLKKKIIRGAFHIINGEGIDMLVPLINTSPPIMREDVVRLQGGVADLRYRPMFEKWGASLHIRYNSRMIQIAQLVQIFSTAGWAVGIGEYRPERDGPYGMFRVADIKAVES